jgi:hypothetical protein
MNAIKYLQENTPKTSVKYQSTQVSLKKPLTPPESPKPHTPPVRKRSSDRTTDPPPVPPRRIVKHATSSPLSNDDIERHTEVYAMWFNDDSLMYKVYSSILTFDKC